METVDSGITPDAAPPEPRLGDIRWLLDGETGSWGTSEGEHDGASRSGCTGRHPETAQISNAIPTHTGDFAIELRLDETWPWGASGCFPGGEGRPRMLVYSREIAPLPRDEEVWIGWAVRVPEDWMPGQTQRVMQMHRGGFGAYFWVELSDDLVWQLSGKGNAIPELSADPIPLRPAQKEQWHEFVVHSVLSQDATLGEVTVWERLKGESEWTLAAEWEGATAAPESALTFSAFPADTMFALTPRGGPWGGDATVWHLYLDEIRVGGPDSTFEEVAPGSNVVLELP